MEKVARQKSRALIMVLLHKAKGEGAVERVTRSVVVETRSKWYAGSRPFTERWEMSGIWRRRRLMQGGVSEARRGVI